MTTASHRSSTGLTRWLPVLAVLGLLLVAYWPALRAGWIWDDDAYVTRNPVVQSADGWWRAWIPGETPQYYPLVFESFWLQFQLHGLQPAWFHAVNLGLHALSAVVLWRVLLRLRIPGALLIVALFALHPVQVESVAWVTERKNVLSMALGLSSVLWWLRWRDESRLGWLALSFAAYMAALLSKTTAVAVPVALVAIEWWRARELAPRRSVYGAVAAFFLAGVALGLNTALVESNLVGARGPEFDRSFMERLAQAAQAWWYYPASWAWPLNLTFMPAPFAQGPEGWLPWLALAGVAMVFATAAVLARRGSRGPMALLLIYCAGIFPALGFINVYPLRYSPVADHFGYVAGVALCIAIGWTLWTVWQVGVARVRGVGAHAPTRTSTLASAGPLAAGILVLTLAVLTWAQSWQYRDEPTLWTWTLRTNPRAWLAANYLGGMELEAAIAAEMRQDGPAMEAHLARAEALIGQAVEHSRRRDMSALANLSEVRRMDRKLPEALALLEEALAVNDQFSKTIWARGSLHEQLGHMEQAGADYERAAITRPPDPRHWRDLVRWRAMHGTPQAALDASNTLISQWPATSQDLANNASLLVQVGEIPAARAMFERALTVSSPEMAQRMLLPMAEAHLQPPNDIRATQRAIELADHLRSLVGNAQPQPLYLLARGHALQGDPDTAVRMMAEADALLPMVPPQALDACTAARAQAVAVLQRSNK